MRIWTRKSASIQPRTSPGKSDGVAAQRCPARGRGHSEAMGSGEERCRESWAALQRPGHFLICVVEGIFVKFLSNFCQISAKSSQFFASKVAFFSIFQNLLDFAKFCKTPAMFFVFFSKFCIFSENFQKILKIFAKFREILQIFANLLARR